MKTAAGIASFPEVMIIAHCYAKPFSTFCTAAKITPFPAVNNCYTFLCKILLNFFLLYTKISKNFYRT